MSRTATRLSVLLLGAALLLVPGARTVTAAGPWVTISNPLPGDFAVGEVTIEAEVLSDEAIALVEFLVDSRSVGMLASPPYELRIDLGDDSGAHHFQVIAHTVNGDQNSAEVRTAALPLGGEVTIELQQLYVVVTDNGERIPDLAQSDFDIWDDGVRQSIVSFALGDIPFTAVLMIDASSSMEGQKLAAAYAGARSFVGGMRQLDEAKVITFSDRMIGVSPFTSDKAVLATELSGSYAQGGTALNDHLFMALKLLEQRQGRRVVVLLSDGVDSHSVLSSRAVFRKAQQSQALIYWIRLSQGFGTADATDEMPALSSMWHDATAYREQLELLEQMVLDSGGYIARVKQLKEIRPVFDGILRDLREQYVIGYYPSNQKNDGSWHSVKVKASGHQVRTHKGYIDL